MSCLSAQVDQICSTADRQCTIFVFRCCVLTLTLKVLPLVLQVEAVANTPALWAEVLHSCVGLVGGEDGDLLAIRTFGCGDDLVLCREDDSIRMANQGERS